MKSWLAGRVGSVICCRESGLLRSAARLKIFNVVIRSPALHYIADFKKVCRKVFHSLTPGGSFVLSVEHPVFTSRAAQDWYYSTHGKRPHWPVDDYQQEELRQTRFLDNDVVKYHRTVETM